MGPAPTALQLQAWASEPSLWFHGFWKNDYGESYVRAASVDARSGRVNISRDTPPCYPAAVHARVMVVNALSELDQAGEYYISPTGVLSLIPSQRASSTQSPTYVLTYRGATQCVLCTLDASYLSFENFEIGYSRGTPISVANGSHLSFKNLTVRASGGHGITLQGGTNCEVVDSRISGVACRALDVSGGSTTRLTPGNHSIRSNLIHSYARIHRTYNPGIAWGGVGNHFVRNTIRDAPHAAILGGGVRHHSNRFPLPWSRKLPFMMLTPLQTAACRI